MALHDQSAYKYEHAFFFAILILYCTILAFSYLTEAVETVIGDDTFIISQQLLSACKNLTERMKHPEVLHIHVAEDFSSFLLL